MLILDREKLSPPLAINSCLWTGQRKRRLSKLALACLVALGGASLASASPSKVEVDGDTLILSGTHELLYSNGTYYTVTGTSDRVKAEDFKTVILNATPTGNEQRATYTYSTRWDAPDTHLIINVTSNFRELP